MNVGDVESKLFRGNLSIMPGNDGESGFLEVQDRIFVDKLQEFTIDNGIDIDEIKISNTSLSPLSGSNITLDAKIIIPDTTDATSYTSGGSLTVSGGLSVAKKAYIGATLYADNINELTTSSGVNVGNINLNTSSLSTTGTFTINNPVSITSTTDASSSSVGGSLTLSGGLGVAKRIYTGLSLDVGTSLNVGTTVNTGSSITVGSVLFTNTITEKLTGNGVRIEDLNITDTTINPVVGSSITLNQQVLIPSITASTSKTTGALVISGGLGVGGSIYAGNIYSNGVLLTPGGGGGTYTAGTNIDITSNVVSVINNPTFSGVVHITNSTYSTNQTTGALVISGGLGVGETIHAGNIYSNGVLLTPGGTGILDVLNITLNNNVSTTSTSYVLLQGMKLTLDAGDYLVSASVNIITVANISFALFLNDTIINNTSVTLSGEDSSYNITTLISVPAAQDLEIRWYSSGGLRTATVRSLNAIKFNASGGSGGGGGGPTYMAGTNIDITDDIISVVNNPTFSGVVNISNLTSSTDINTGALVVSGGLGVSENINIGGDLSVNTNTLIVDATNNRVGIVSSTPGYPLDVAGDVNTSGVYRIGGTSVLSSTTLGSGITSSSLTSVGTLTSLNVSGNINMNNNKIINCSNPTNNSDAATKEYVDSSSVINFYINFNNNVSTTSTSYILIPGMTLSLTPGKWTVIASANSISTGNISYGLFLNGSLLSSSECNLTGEDSSYFITFTFTINSNQDLDMRWKSSGGSRTVNCRSLNAIRIN